jgi:integrase/recombinase XerD
MLLWALMKVKVVLEKFINDLQSKNRSVSTILAYRKDVEQLIEVTKDKEIDAVTTKEIDKFKEKLAGDGYTAKSISRKINAIKSFFRFAKANDYAKTDPSLSVAHPKYEVKTPRVLTKIEYRALRDTSREDTRMAAIIELLLQTGMRIGELARLEIKDINFDKKLITIRVYQSQSSRRVPLNDAAKKALKKYLDQRPKSKNQNFFLTKTGNQFLVRNIRSAVNRYFKIAGIKNARVNDLRNTFIVQQLKAGVPLVTVSKIVGHKRISTTEKYLELVGETGKERVKLEEL